MHTPTVRINGRTYPLEDFNEMDRLELLKLRRDVEGELHEICAQIEAEELAPQHDEAWLVRVSRAKRAYTRALRHLEGTLEIRKVEHQRSLLNNFMSIAREDLPPEVFSRIYSAAQNLTK